MKETDPDLTKLKSRLPCEYFPWMKGKYEVAPELAPLGTHFGNGESDRKIHQFDATFHRYYENKLNCRREDSAKYVRDYDLSEKVAARAVRGLVDRLRLDEPNGFEISASQKMTELRCLHTGNVYCFDPHWRIENSSGYVETLDLLACEFPEDVAIVRAEGGRDWIAFGQVCSPSHWALQEKIGKSFVEVHAPVPGIERLNRSASALMLASIQKGPYVRFVWSLVNDDRLNRHPEPPPGVDAALWGHRPMDFKSDNPFFIRVERQTVLGMPEVDAFMFFIHVYFVSAKRLKEDASRAEAFVKTLATMSDVSKTYKRVPLDTTPINQYLLGG